jgi:predicted transcriptional regulator
MTNRIIPAWQIILAYLSEHTPTNKINIYKHIKLTYTHIVNVLCDLEKAGIIEYKIKGREHIVHLTKKGKILADSCMVIVGIMGESHE